MFSFLFFFFLYATKKLIKIPVGVLKEMLQAERTLYTVAALRYFWQMRCELFAFSVLTALI